MNPAASVAVNLAQLFPEGPVNLAQPFLEGFVNLAQPFATGFVPLFAERSGSL
jgi:hypothetical protein